MARVAFRRLRTATICLVLCLVVGSGCSEQTGTQFEAPSSEPPVPISDSGWRHHGLTPSEKRFSPLASINRDNVHELGLAWSVEFPTHRGLEATPLVVDGTLYTTSAWSVVYAIDGKSGSINWVFDPEVPKSWGVFACCDVVNRGVAYHDERIFLGTLDGRLIALDAHTGEVVWETNTIDRSKPYTITGAPRVVKDQVVIGNGGAEYGVRGYVSAYDIDTGTLNWRFFTVPGNPQEPAENLAMEQAIPTWHGEWWTVGGGGTVWDAMAFDSELDILYIGTGNGAPWNRVHRSEDKGDNLYLSSIIALNPDDGNLIWYYQTTPGDTWDFTATQQLVLADLEISGSLRQVIMQAPKNGFFYVLDRVTGELISAEAFTEVTWASHVDLETGRPVEVEGARYESGEPKFVKPGTGGAHGWQSMSYSDATGLMYIPVLDAGYIYAQGERKPYDPRVWNTGVNQQIANQHLPKDLLFGHLLAWDPVSQSEAWRAPHRFGWNGGVVSTAGGLVLQGKAEGDFAAYDDRTGDELWSFDTYNGVIAAPITYSIDGEQYIAVMAGWGGIFPLVGGEAAKVVGIQNRGGRLLVFKLGGSAKLERPGPVPVPPEPPEVPKQEELFADGKGLFAEFCARCHGAAAIGGGSIKDVRFSPPALISQMDKILLDGILEPVGMPAFATVLSADDVAALEHYIRVKARVDFETGNNWY